jgi:hypothetical protein
MHPFLWPRLPSVIGGCCTPRVRAFLSKRFAESLEEDKLFCTLGPRCNKLLNFGQTRFAVHCSSQGHEFDLHRCVIWPSPPIDAGKQLGLSETRRGISASPTGGQEGTTTHQILNLLFYFWIHGVITVRLPTALVS